jgi:transposase
VLIAQVRPKAGVARRCSRCQQRCPGYDSSATPRRWQGLDLGTTQVFLQATTRRVACPEQGVVVAAVPWARPGSRFTAACEDTVAWLVCHAALPVVAVLLRVAWRCVDAIMARVVAARAGQIDRLGGLHRIGIDEISSPLGPAVSAGHDRSRHRAAGMGRQEPQRHDSEPVLHDPGADRAAALTHVTADGAEWIHEVVAARAPKAVLCHLVEPRGDDHARLHRPQHHRTARL